MLEDYIKNYVEVMKNALKNGEHNYLFTHNGWSKDIAFVSNEENINTFLREYGNYFYLKEGSLYLKEGVTYKDLLEEEIALRKDNIDLGVFEAFKLDSKTLKPSILILFGN